MNQERATFPKEIPFLFPREELLYAQVLVKKLFLQNSFQRYQQQEGWNTSWRLGRFQQGITKFQFWVFTWNGQEMKIDFGEEHTF